MIIVLKSVTAYAARARLLEELSEQGVKVTETEE